MTRPDLEFITAPAPMDEMPFSQAVRAGETVYLSGQLGTAAGTLELVSGGIEAESRQMMENVKVALERAGSSLEQVVKCTVFLADMGEWAAFNSVYTQFFQAGRLPARSAIGSCSLALGARVEIECVAVTP